MQLYAINTGFFKLDGGAMFGVVPKSLWEKFHAADENNLCSWALRCLLIQAGGKLILIDNGIGDKQDAKFFSHYYLHGTDTLDKSLASYGFHRDDITDVVLTHLHFDHCGGSIIRSGAALVPAFKNATYWSNERHWDWAVNPNDREKASFLTENILPIRESGQLKMVAVEGTGHLPSGIIPELSYRIVNGHTESMMLPVIAYKERTLVFMADLLPSVGHLPTPYVMAYDVFPLTSMEEKKSFLQEALANQWILFFEHDPINECCIVRTTERGIRTGDVFRLGEM